MAHPQVSALPPISASLAPRPANAPADTAAGADGDAQAFARVLAQKSNGAPREARSPAQDGPRPAKAPDSTEPAAKPQDGQANAPAQTPEAPDPATGVEVLAEAAALAAPPAASPDPSLPELIATAEVAPEVVVTEESQDGSAGPVPDALEASLAGIPAALAALMAGITPGNGAAPSPGAVPAQAGPETKLGEHFPGQGRRFLPASGAEAATGPAVVAGPETPASPATVPEDATEGFTAALASARPDKTPTVAAVDTPFGPASRASETAQAAANPAAGDAAAAPGPAAPHAPGAPHLPGALPPSAAAPAAQNHPGDSLLHLHVPQPPGHPAWAEAVGSRVTWMVGQRESTAELVLTPPQLGRVEVNLTVSGDQTTAQFVAATPAAREALEQALPRLREVLAEAGINLADSGVSTSDRQDGGRQAPRQNPGRLADNLPPVEAGAKPGVAWGQTGRGLVDTFA